ncbi:neuronal-specific septin-3-like [Corticium candelabrum]|uniref:neuronal-specific septin-3-like n=1 Tax=Corticium candelabrum TaxID=121492 RepID=UPI002E3036EA|nr:neuronal-specific septin-3-like [Corticium candelabrum]
MDSKKQSRHLTQAQADVLTKVFSKANVDEPGHVPPSLVPELITQVFGTGISSTDLEQLQRKAEAKATRSGIDLLDFIELARGLMRHTTQWGTLQTRLDSYVGFDTIQDQLKKKCLKRGFEVNLMVVGESGLGKSTLVNTLFKSKVSRNSCAPDENPMPKTVDVRSVSHVIEEQGVRLKLTITDTPGFGDQINNDHCWLPVLDYVNEQFEVYLNEEVSVTRRKNIPDSRVHACLYFISPTGHHLQQLDVEFMKRLDQCVNIIPVIAKSDTMTLEERNAFKARIREDINHHGINIYPCAYVPEDDEDAEENAKIENLLPFAVVGSDREYKIGGKKVLGRQTKWGFVEIENKQHCEFSHLRDMLIRTHMQDLKETTDKVHYENFRRSHMQTSSDYGGESNI